MTKLLFVCSQNKLRSKTGEEVFRSEKVETKSAGTDLDAVVVLSPDLVEWADVVVFMETHHRNTATGRRALKRALHGKRQVVLGVPDEYERMDPVLVDLLKEKLPAFCRNPG